MKKRVALYIIFVLFCISLIIFYVVNTNNQKKAEQIKKKAEQIESNHYFNDSNIANDDNNITN